MMSVGRLLLVRILDAAPDPMVTVDQAQTSSGWGCVTVVTCGPLIV